MGNTWGNRRNFDLMRKGKDFPYIRINWKLENVTVVIIFYSKTRKWVLTHRCLSCSELEELIYVTDKETVFINMGSFEEWDPNFIIVVLYSNSHLLSLPKLLQFDKLIKNPCKSSSLWWYNHRSYREKYVMRLMEAHESAALTAVHVVRRCSFGFRVL